MKRFLMCVILCLSFAASGFAQQPAANAPATRQEVEKLFQVMHVREMVRKQMQAILVPMHQMIHREFLRNKAKCKLPADFEAIMEKRMDKMLTGMPWDKMIQAMIPVYQKNLSGRDIEAGIAFYGSPAGQEFLQKLPAIMADSMQVMMPIINRREAAWQQGMKKDIAQMIKQSGQKSCPATTGP